MMSALAVDVPKRRVDSRIGASSRASQAALIRPTLPLRVHTSDLQLADIDAVITLAEQAATSRKHAVPATRDHARSRLESLTARHVQTHIGMLASLPVTTPSPLTPLRTTQPPAAAIPQSSRLPHLSHMSTRRAGLADATQSWAFVTRVNCSSHVLAQPLTTAKTGMTFLDTVRSPTGAALTTTRKASLLPVRLPAIGAIPKIASRATRPTALVPDTNHMIAMSPSAALCATSVIVDASSQAAVPSSEARPERRPPRAAATLHRRPPDGTSDSRGDTATGKVGYTVHRHNPPPRDGESLCPLNALNDYNRRVSTLPLVAVLEESHADLSTSHAAQLQKLADECAEVFIGMAPRVADEPSYAEESLEARVELRQRYRALHPPEHVTLASDLPREMMRSLAELSYRQPASSAGPSVTVKAVVEVEYEGRAGEGRQRGAPQPRGLDYKLITGGTQLADGSLPEDRDDGRLAVLRERQRAAELHFGFRRA
jgi:hypothetical protein